MSIKEFVQKVLSSKSNRLNKYEIGKLTKTELERLKKETNFDLREYIRVIDSYGIKHALKKHENEKLEKKQGQVAINVDDFEKIPEICSNPDKIESGIKNSYGNDLIKYTKTFENQITYVEEKRDSKKELGTKTMYKKKKP